MLLRTANNMTLMLRFYAEESQNMTKLQREK